jgi:DNA-binding XRE family transcriptional regulator
MDSALEASRTKLAELQRKSRNLSASLRRSEHVMTNSQQEILNVEAQAKAQVNRRLGSPAWSKYGNSQRIVGTSSSSSSSSSTPRRNAPSSSLLHTPTDSTQSTLSSKQVNVAYEQGFERQKELLKRELAVNLARDLADTRARNEELQHANAMKDVQLRVCESENARLRQGERKYMEQVSSLSNTVADLKTHVDRQEDTLNQYESRNQSAGVEQEEMFKTLSVTRQTLVQEKIERESVARQLIIIHDERNGLHRELTNLRESVQIKDDEHRRERINIGNYQQETRIEIEQLQEQLRKSIQETADFRRSTLLYRVKAEEAENVMEQNLLVHKTTIEQLVTTRERLKREQDARWEAESESARLRSSVAATN